MRQSLANDFWLTSAKLITPSGIRDGAVRIAQGRIAAMRGAPPRGARAISLRGAFLAPGFIDLHIWGDPKTVSAASARSGTTAFLSAIGPEARARVTERLKTLRHLGSLPGARCLGAHLEGPILNPRRAGALPSRWMRHPTGEEIRGIVRSGAARLITIAPEVSGAEAAIRRLRAGGVVVSLGHSEATIEQARRAAGAGARAVTHAFNGMPTFHHRKPGLVGAALTDERLVAMAILDGVHIQPEAFRLLLRAKGPERIALVTDSIEHEHPYAQRRGIAYYTASGALAGSGLTMIEAVRNAVRLGGASLLDAVRMATETPAKLLGLRRTVGTLAVGKRADLVVFDERFHVLMTVVGGRIVYSLITHH